MSPATPDHDPRTPEPGEPANGATHAPAGDGDRFPTSELVSLVGRLRAYPVLAYRLASDPRVPAARRAAVLGAAAYMVSPIDAVPGFIPLVGQLDDVAVALLSIHVALRGLDEESQRAHLAAVGLDASVLDRDLETVRTASAWLVRRGVRVGAAAARAGGRVAVAGGRVAVAGARVGARVGARAGARAGATGLELGQAVIAKTGSVRARTGQAGVTRGAAAVRTGAGGAARRGRSLAGALRTRLGRREPARHREDPGERGPAPLGDERPPGGERDGAGSGSG